MEVNSTQIKEGIIRVQCDWEEEFKLSGRTSFWVSHSPLASSTGKNSYGKIFVSSSPSLDNHSLEGEDDFGVVDYDKTNYSWILITSPNQYTTSKFLCPRKSFRNIHAPKKSVNDVDISPKGSLGISGGDNSVLKIWDIQKGEVLRELKGHVGDILVSRFFPSGEVVLSADIQIKIWSAIDGTCAAVLKGHVQGVLDVALIDRGRNFISVSRDGTAKLWETGSQSTITTWGDPRRDLPKNCCWICPNIHPVHSQRELDPREYGTESKLALIGGEDKCLQGIDLRSQIAAFSVHIRSPINACTAASEKEFYCGSEDGTVYAWDARSMSKPVASYQRTSASITSLRPSSTPNCIWVTTADGLAFLHDTTVNHAILDLTGPDYERVTKITERGNTVATSCRDGVIRVYDVKK